MDQCFLEVERATRLLNQIGSGKKIVKVETTEDTIVYSGITHTGFVSPSLSGEDLVIMSMIGRVSDGTQDGSST